MNEKLKQKLANKTVYIILSVLMVAILTVTVIAIVSTASRRNSPPIIEEPDNTAPPVSGNPDDPPVNGDPDDETPGDVDPDPEDPIQVFVVPANGYIQKDYSHDVLVFSMTMDDYRVHLGIDIAGNLGDPVFAFSDGVVEKIYTDPFMGKTIILNHGNGLKSHYMNLSDTIPEGIIEGGNITAGTIIGGMGETAIIEAADGPHLHFEVWLNGKRTNPVNYVVYDDLVPVDQDFED